MMNQQKVVALKNIVSSVTGVDIFDTSRKREIIQARAMCYKIMRDEMFFSLKFIGDQFGKNHATVMHGLKEFPYMLKFDSVMAEQYGEVLSIWLENSEEYVEFDPIKLKNIIKDLQDDNNLLNLRLTEVQEELKTFKSLYENFLSTDDSLIAKKGESVYAFNVQ